jgi:hypothetical protein
MDSMTAPGLEENRLRLVVYLLIQVSAWQMTNREPISANKKQPKKRPAHGLYNDRRNYRRHDV